jgi:hypothetical protein
MGGEVLAEGKGGSSTLVFVPRLTCALFVSDDIAPGALMIGAPVSLSGDAITTDDGNRVDPVLCEEVAVLNPVAETLLLLGRITGAMSLPNAALLLLRSSVWSSGICGFARIDDKTKPAWKGGREFEDSNTADAPVVELKHECTCNHVPSSKPSKHSRKSIMAHDGPSRWRAMSRSSNGFECGLDPVDAPQWTLLSTGRVDV